MMMMMLDGNGFSRQLLCNGFVPGNENVMELSLPGAKRWWKFRSREQKSCGTLALNQKHLDII